MSTPLPRSFFEQPTLDVAQALIGKTLVFNEKKGIITETEAYLGDHDPACHSYRGQTPRNAVMFGPAGHSYVYFIYGMHYCFNIVTESSGIAHAVLIRGLLPTDPPGKRLDGPARLTKYLGIKRAHNGLDLCQNKDYCVLNTAYNGPILTTPRIGISQATEYPWRFVMPPQDSPISHC